MTVLNRIAYGFALTLALSLSAHAKPVPQNAFNSNVPDRTRIMGIMESAPATVDTYTYAYHEAYSHPSLGYAMTYQSPQMGHATVYIYPVPTAIANQPSQDIVVDMMELTISGIHQAEQMGIYQNFTIVDEQLLNSSQNSEGRVYGSYIMRGQPANTAIYLTEQDGNLFKIRISAPNTHLDEVVPDWDRFADQMFEFLIENKGRV